MNELNDETKQILPEQDSLESLIDLPRTNKKNSFLLSKFFNFLFKNRKDFSPLLTSFIVSLITSTLVIVVGLLIFKNYLDQFSTPVYYTKVEKTKVEEKVTTTEPNTSYVASEALPAVVAIKIYQQVPVYKTVYENPFGNMFPGFSMPKQVQVGTTRKEVGGGSGFFVTSNGTIVTNKHVVNSQNSDFEVVTNSNKTYKANLVYISEKIDVAVLKINVSGVPYLSFGDSDQLQVGEPVVAIGNALAQFSNSVSSGIISGLSRTINASSGGKIEQLERVIQTDAAINPGNSGGPLINRNGKVVGVNVAVALNGQNIGFALTSNSVKAEIANYLR